MKKRSTAKHPRPPDGLVAEDAPRPPQASSVSVIQGDPATLLLQKPGGRAKTRFLAISAPDGAELSYWTTNAGFTTAWMRDDERYKSWALALDPTNDALAFYRAEPGRNPIRWKMLAELEGGGGLRILGSIQGGTGHFRGDSALEASGQNGIISLFQSENPGTAANETALAYGAYDSAGSIAKTASISSKWVSPAAGTGYAVLRLNSTYGAGGGGRRRHPDLRQPRHLAVGRRR